MAKSPSTFMIGWEYPPHNSGGLGVACQGLTEALSTEFGVPIYFTLPYQLDGSVQHMQVMSAVHPNWQIAQKNQPPFFAYDGSVQLQKVDLDRHAFSRLPSSQLEHQVNEYAQAIDSAHASMQPNQQNDFDVIHAHDWMSFPAATKMHQKTGKPMIAHVHSTEFDRSPHGGSRFISDTEYEGMMQATRVVAVSNYTKRLLVQKYGIPAGKIDVVHNGMKPGLKVAKSGLKTSRPVVTFLGRLTGQKGVPYFLQLAKKVTEKIPDALFVVAGHGDMYQELLLKTAQEKLSATVLFSGFVRGQQKQRLLAGSNVFVMPSVSEPFGLVALEAAEQQVPVIISKTSGVAEVMPSALAVDFWDLDLMAENIVQLLENPQQSQAQVAQQNNEIAQVTWTNAADRLTAVYRKAFLG